MFLNGIDISTYGATLLDKNISPNRISQDTRWEYDFDRPTFFGSSLDFKDGNIWLRMDAETEFDFIKNLGKITEQLRVGAEVQFKGIDLTYMMYLKQKPDYERLNKTTYKVTLVLDSDFGITKRKVVSQQKVTSVSINNEGNYSTPVELTLKVLSAKNEIVIQGFDRTLVLVNTPSNATIYINSTIGEITINGNPGIDNLKSFHLPKLNAGETVITSSVECDLSIAFYERY